MWFVSGLSATLALVVIPVVFIVGMIKPALFKPILRERALRSDIALILSGLFVSLIILCGITAPTGAESAHTDNQGTDKQRTLVTEDRTRKSARVSKAETKDVTEKHVVAFSKERREDGDMPKGSTKISQTGKNGEKVLTFEVIYRDGKEISRRLKAEVITVRPINEITNVDTYVYTPPAPAPRPSSGGSVKKSKTGICHAPGTTYYDRTTNYTGFPSLQACLDSGGRLPLR